MTQEVYMNATPGDRLVIKSHHVGEHDKVAEILEVHGVHGKPPYLIRWSDDEHEGLIFPGSDASVERRRTRPTAPRNKA